MGILPEKVTPPFRFESLFIRNISYRREISSVRLNNCFKKRLDFGKVSSSMESNKEEKKSFVKQAKEHTPKCRTSPLSFIR